MVLICAGDNWGIGHTFRARSASVLALFLISSSFQCYEALVEMNRTISEATWYLVAFLQEWFVAQFGIISCERKVSDGVQVLCVYLFPVRAKVLSPCQGQVLILGNNMLNRVLFDIHQ